MLLILKDAPFYFKYDISFSIIAFTYILIKRVYFVFSIINPLLTKDLKNKVMIQIFSVHTLVNNKIMI